MRSTMNYDKLIRLCRANMELPIGGQLHFSFIMKKKKIISFGYNNAWKSSPYALKYGHRFLAIHSELMAIKNFPYPVGELYRFTFVNVRLRTNGEIALSKPCECCQRMLDAFGINELYYTTNNGDFVQW